MKLSQLLSLYSQLKWGDSATVDVTSITQDSRHVGPGTVFVAIRGSQRDGHQFLAEVAAQGAAALIVEDEHGIPANYKGAVVQVGDSRTALDMLAAKYYGNPANKMFCVGVTGTNGKTSSVYMIEQILTRFGWPTGVIGTIDHHLGQRIWSSHLTTPDALMLQRRLAELVSLGAEAVAFEVSSHALDQHRVDSVPFDVAVFTNLTRDHLDYHGTMEQYFHAKERLFHELLGRTGRKNMAVLNADDPMSSRIHIHPSAKLWMFGQKPCHFQFRILKQDFAGTLFHLVTPRGPLEVQLATPGLHNVYNACGAIAVGMAAGVSAQVCSDALLTFRGAPGRLEAVSNDLGLAIFVDYAHTDDALRSVLLTLNEIRRQIHSTGRIITVFGCGGDRDRGKRPLMAKAAVAGSDLVILTSDNPRSEDPESIIADCKTGIESERLNQTVFVVVDRAQAIERALQMAQEGDVILIAGKGHEDYQIVGNQKLPFSDVQVVRAAAQSKKKA